MKKIDNKATDWAYDRYASAVIWNKRLIWLSVIAFLSTIILAITIMLMLPLKEQIPIFVRVDNVTGNIDVLTTLDEYTMTADEALDEAFLITYLRNRENYLYQTFESNYEQVMALSDTRTGRNYYEMVIDDQNPNNPFYKYSDKIEAVVKINNLTHTKRRISQQPGVAVIRFTLTETNKLGENKVQRKIATITYEYTPSELDRKRRWINPLGFVVTSYIVEDEY